MNKFDMYHKVAIITGGAGLLGVQHARAIAECGGTPILWDICHDSVREKADSLAKEYNISITGMHVDITKEDLVIEGLKQVLDEFKQVDILINNASNNPKIQDSDSLKCQRLEFFCVDQWDNDIAVSLTGAFLCSKVIGSHMAKNNGGVIVNICSDLGIIAPDQRIYRQNHIAEDEQPVKPVTYSVVKHGLIGLTRYLATYWADKNVRVNALSPGGVYADQPKEFVEKLTNLIPLARMANVDEYKGAIQFLCSDASSYMTGNNLVIDGGRTCW